MKKESKIRTDIPQYAICNCLWHEGELSEIKREQVLDGDDFLHNRSLGMEIASSRKFDVSPEGVSFTAVRIIDPEHLHLHEFIYYPLVRIQIPAWANEVKIIRRILPNAILPTQRLNCAVTNPTLLEILFFNSLFVGENAFPEVISKDVDNSLRDLFAKENAFAQSMMKYMSRYKKGFADGSAI